MAKCSIFSCPSFDPSAHRPCRDCQLYDPMPRPVEIETPPNQPRVPGGIIKFAPDPDTQEPPVTNLELRLRHLLTQLTWWEGRPIAIRDTAEYITATMRLRDEIAFMASICEEVAALTRKAEAGEQWLKFNELRKFAKDTGRTIFIEERESGTQILVCTFGMIVDGKAAIKVSEESFDKALDVSVGSIADVKAGGE